MNTKIIAWYLPQYHSIPENDEFWGKGFTDWTTVKRAIPLYKNHHQPRIPLYDNYYDLSIKTNIEWQAKLAKKYGVYGFGIYHYWFNNDKNILTKPANIIHDDKNIDINYLFAWDNASWVRSWSAVAGNAWAPIADRNQSKYKDRDILIPYILGKERDWKNHYSHLLQHFKDDRYIKDDNKPVKDDKLNDIQDNIQDITKIKQYIKVAARYNVDKLVDSLTKRHVFDGEAFGPLISAANNDSADSAKDHLRYFLTGIGDAREFNLRWNKDNMHLHFLIRILLTENLAINENNAVTIFSEKTISKSKPDDISFEESREPIWPSVEAVFNRKNLISSTWRFRKKDDTRNGHQKTLQNIARIVFACDVKS